MFTQDYLKLFLFVCIVEVSSYTHELESMVTYEVDVGKNLTIPCLSQVVKEHEDDQHGRVLMWIREGKQNRHSSGMIVLPNGTLVLTNISRDDSGVYRCMEDGSEHDSDNSEVSQDVLARVLVHVRAAPPPLSNVEVKPSTALVTLFWDVNDTGGYPIDFFSARYRLQDPQIHSSHATHHWHWVEPKRIPPTVRLIDVYQLKPNSSYVFQMWATNHLGPGQKTEIISHTEHNEAEIEMVRHMLEGAETFDTRVWVAAVAVVMGTLVMLALGTCYLLYRECHLPSMNLDEHEFMELVPHIILNPGFHDDDDRLERDENCNDRNIVHINNNSVIRPYRI